MNFFLYSILAQMVMKISHRGYIGNKCVMENSLESITNALNKNFDVIELDLQLTKDNIIVLHHDLYVGSEDSNYKLISDINYSDLKKNNNKILTISELFKINDIDKKGLYLDLKGSDNLSNELIKFFNNDFSFKNNLYLGSFNKKHLNDLSTYNKINDLNLKLGYITDNRLLDKDLIKCKNEYNIDFLSLNWEMLRVDTLDFLKENKIKCFAFTCKNKFILDYINKFDIDGIVTDLLI